MLAHVWNSQDWGPMTEESIRRRHSPAGSHRLSVSHYPPGTSFPGVMKAGTCYVLRGKCRYTFQDSVVLSRGTWSELPGGQFHFEVLGNEELTVVTAWLLPPEFRTKSDA